jgi:hypothetical protein
MNPIILSWPFKGLEIDMIFQIHPSSSKIHKYILEATHYFTKWVEAIPLKNVMFENMIGFIKEHIIYRFGIPHTITIDQGTLFTSEEFDNFCANMGSI